MPPRGRRNATPEAEEETETRPEEEIGEFEDPDTFDGPEDENPAHADPDAVSLTPAPTDPEDDVQDPDEDIDLTKADQHDDPEREYVVLTDALNVAVGEKPEDVVRLSRGQSVRFSEQTRKFTNVREFVRLGAIAENDGEPKARATAASLAQRAGGGDPVPTAGQALAREQATAKPVQ